MTRLKKTLAWSGLKQVWVAKQVGMEYRIFNRIVQGYIEPVPEDKKKIAKVLGVTVKDLWPEGNKGG